MDHEPRPDSRLQLVHDELLIPAEKSVSLRAPSISQMIEQIRETADKLIKDGASRGDVKLLNTALKELRYCFKLFSRYRQYRKISIFGSARLPPEDPAFKACVEFSRRMAEIGYMVITGAGNGIMEAGHIGAGREMSIGVNILLPFEQSANPVIDGDIKLMHLKYFFTRKLLFVKETDAVALFAGGFGTQDEAFEALTLVQTAKSHLFPIVLMEAPGDNYWHLWQRFITETLLPRNLISKADLSLYRITDNIDEAVREIEGFYRNYHSMRYVGKDLVLRLKEPLKPALLKKIEEDFADIITQGRYEQCGPLSAEENEPELMHLSRLKFCFDRRHMGRLRQLVDIINTN